MKLGTPNTPRAAACSTVAASRAAVFGWEARAGTRPRPGRPRAPARAHCVVKWRDTVHDHRLEQAPAERRHGAEPGCGDGGEHEAPRVEGAGVGLAVGQAE
jgi:hypothetical protein